MNQNDNVSSGQRHEVTANIQHLMKILTTRLNSDPYAPIREYISNAYDATRAMPDPKISIWGESSRLVIQDNGLGMTRQVILDAYTQIAGHFSELDDNESVGMFGIGVLSAFMVAERLVVDTRSIKEPHGWRLEWVRGEPTFSLSATDRHEPGTRATLFLDSDAAELATDYVLRDYISKTFALFPVPISLGINQPAVNVHWKWLADQTQQAKNPRLLLERDAITLIRQFTHLELAAAYVSHQPDRSRVFLGIPSGEFSPLDLHKVAFFCKGIVVHGNMRAFFPENLAFVVGLVDHPSFMLQIDREGFVKDPTFRQVKEGMEGHILQFLELLADEHPSAIENILRTHRTMLVAHAQKVPKLRELFRKYYRFETSAGDSLWKDILPFAVSAGDGRSRKTIYALSTTEGFQEVISAAQTKGVVTVFAVGAERMLLEDIAKSDGVAIEDAAKLQDWRDLREVPQPFQRLGAKLGTALIGRGVGAIVLVNLPHEGQQPATFRVKSSSGGLVFGDEKSRETGLVSVDALMLNIAHPLVQRLAGKVQDLDADLIRQAANILFYVAVLHSPFRELAASISGEVIANLIDNLEQRLGARNIRAHASSSRAKCFVALPYRETFDNVWLGLRQVLAVPPYSWSLVRADEHIGGDNLFSNVQEHVAESRRYVADISGLNPNVLIELGLMLQQDRNAVLILCDEETYDRGQKTDPSCPNRGVPTDLKGKVIAVYPNEKRITPDAMVQWLRDRIPTYTEFAALQGTALA